MSEKAGLPPDDAEKGFMVEQRESAGPSIEVVGFETSPMSNREVKDYLENLNPLLTERFLVEKVAFIKTLVIRGGDTTWDADTHSQTIKMFSTFNEVGKGDEVLDTLTPKEKLQWGLAHETGECIFRLIDAIERRKGFLKEIADKNQNDELLVPQLIAKEHLLSYYTAAVFRLLPVTKYAEMEREMEWGKPSQEWADDDFAWVHDDFAEAYALFKLRPEELRRKSEYRFRAINLIDKLIRSSNDEVAEKMDYFFGEIEAFQEESRRINRERRARKSWR